MRLLQEMSEMVEGTDGLPSEMVTKMGKDYSQIKQAVREYEVRYEELENKLRQRNEGQRKTI